MYGIFILAIYALIMISATVFFTRKSKGSDFHTADRNIGAVISILSIAATWIWAPALFVSGSQAYTNGIPGLFWFLVPNVLCLIIFIPFAKKIRKEMPQGVTLSGYMADKYKSEKVKGIYLFQLGSLSVLSTAVQLLAGSQVLSFITGTPFWLMTILLAIIAFSYSQFSGIKASITTDVIQIIFILIGCAVILPFAFKNTSGFTTLLNGLNGVTGDFGSLFDKAGLKVFLSYGLPTTIGLISGPFGDQSFWQRTFSIKEKHIGKAFFFGALVFSLVPLSMGIVGYFAAGSGFIANDSSMVNFEFISTVLPKWIIVPFLFMIISGLLSTVDSNLCSAASLTVDRNKKETPNQNIKTSKMVMVLLLTVAIVIANVPGITVTHLFLFYGTLRATTLLPTILTLKGKKLTAKGIYIGVICSLLVGLPIFAYGSVMGIATLKTVGSLVSVLLSGIIAVAMREREVKEIASR